MACPFCLRSRGEGGIALLVVLVILLIIGGSSASFVWFMNQAQTRAGSRYRSAAALDLAEAGVQRALSILETVAPDGSPGRAWRPIAYSEAMRSGPLEGRFVISLAEDVGGAVSVTSIGEVGGIERRLRARVYLASPALLAALHGASFVRIERPPAAAFILPYGAGIGDRPWMHIAAGRGIWFASTDVSINDPSRVPDVAAGPVDAPAGPSAATTPPHPGPVRLLLARDADLTLDQDQQRVDIQQLRAIGIYVEAVVLRSDALPALPEVDRFFYQAASAANTANARLNEDAGRYLNDDDLARKPDSLYSAQDFAQLQSYLKAGLHPSKFRGIVYVKGRVALLEGQQMAIDDGALVSESTVQISRNASLEILHSAATRTWPALIVLDNGALVVTQGGRLRAHGLVYASRVVDIGEGARVDIVGSLLGNDHALSFRSYGATVVIRYDPAVLGTPGLHAARDAPVVAWVAAWEER